jgi:predicted Rossmann-fold nucleotide-binding protein
VEIMTWAQLGQHRKPMVLVNIKGFWAPMMAMLNHIRNAGFLHRDHLLQPIVVDRAEDVIPAIVAAAAKDGAPKAGGSSIIDKM